MSGNGPHQPEVARHAWASRVGLAIIPSAAGRNAHAPQKLVL